MPSFFYPLMRNYEFLKNRFFCLLCTLRQETRLQGIAREIVNLAKKALLQSDFFESNHVVRRRLCPSEKNSSILKNWPTRIR